jgi:hypothetical protein
MKKGMALLMANIVTWIVSHVPTSDATLKFGQVSAVYATLLLSLVMSVYYVNRTLLDRRESNRSAGDRDGGNDWDATEDFPGVPGNDE